MPSRKSNKRRNNKSKQQQPLQPAEHHLDIQPQQKSTSPKSVLISLKDNKFVMFKSREPVNKIKPHTVFKSPLTDNAKKEHSAFCLKSILKVHHTNVSSKVLEVDIKEDKLLRKKRKNSTSLDKENVKLMKDSNQPEKTILLNIEEEIQPKEFVVEDNRSIDSNENSKLKDSIEENFQKQKPLKEKDIVNHSCVVCLKDINVIKRCSRCKNDDFYCGVSCQQTHWNHHKKNCLKLLN
ncbi:hypothetical protein HDU92_000057 [Lobulomyces angularis]|nr:hypothetical protein HDU92_000057 [Lobulomyces angularis]